MRAMIEVLWSEGECCLTRIPEAVPDNADLRLVTGSTVTNLQSETDISYSVDGGLWLEVRYHEPNVRAEFGERGRETINRTGYWIQILTPQEIEKVAAVYYEGELMFTAVAGELVNVQRLSVLNSVYLSDSENTAVLETIANLADVIKGLGGAGTITDEQVAAGIGISANVLSAAYRTRDVNSSEDSAKKRPE